jgi:hypothetical protein
MTSKLDHIRCNLVANWCPLIELASTPEILVAVDSGSSIMIQADVLHTDAVQWLHDHDEIVPVHTTKKSTRNMFFERYY